MLRNARKTVASVIITLLLGWASMASAGQQRFTLKHIGPMAVVIGGLSNAGHLALSGHNVFDLRIVDRNHPSLTKVQAMDLGRSSFDTKQEMTTRMVFVSSKERNDLHD